MERVVARIRCQLLAPSSEATGASSEANGQVGTSTVPADVLSYRRREREPSKKWKHKTSFVLKDLVFTPSKTRNCKNLSQAAHNQASLYCVWGMWYIFSLLT